MNIKISIVIFILLSFFNIGAISNAFYSNRNALCTLENNIRDKNEFEENGVRLQYKTKENLEKEIFRIKKYLISNIEGNYEEIKNNEFRIFNNDYNINVKMWCEDKYNCVEITLINRNCSYLIWNLIDMLKNLENKKTEEVKYYSYYEGKELSNSASIDKFIKENNIHDIKKLKISNGYTGTGYLNNRDKINFAQVRYDTGSHIIIGTPIIFTTY